MLRIIKKFIFKKTIICSTEYREYYLHNLRMSCKLLAEKITKYI